MRAVASQTLVRGAGGSGRPSGSRSAVAVVVDRLARAVDRAAEVVDGRPVRGVAADSRGRRSAAGRSGAEQEPVVKVWPQKW